MKEVSGVVSVSNMQRMVIQGAKKNHSEGAVQKKDKIKAATVGSEILVLTDGDDEEEKEIHVAKKKHLKGEKGSKQVNTQKKKKKTDSKLKNKACGDHPIIIQSNLDSESQKETEKSIIESGSDSESIKETGKTSKKFKKQRDQGLSCEQDSSWQVPSKGLPKNLGETNFLVSKKCKRNVSECCVDTHECPAKRKKKREHKRTSSLMLLQSEDNEDVFLVVGKRFHKKTKATSQEMMFSDRQKRETSIRNAANVCGIVKKSKGVSHLASKGNQENTNGISGQGVADTLCLGRACSHKQDPVDAVYSSGEEGKAAQKKWKKEKMWKKKNKQKLLKKEKHISHLTPAAIREDDPDVFNETVLKTKSKKKPGDVEDKMSLIQNSKGDSKVTKNKKIHTKVVSGHSALIRANGDASTDEEEAAVKRTKSKVKKSKEVQDHSHQNGSSEKNSKQPVKTKRKMGGSQDSKEEPRLKKAKIKEEEKEGEDEIKVVAVKKGNCDETSIDKLRRQALQEEIDRVSGKTKAIKQEEELDAHFGQWSTATFESSERKSKFLRLLGGFKKSSAPAQASPVQTTKLSMALTRTGEEKLQQNLQADFEKAMDLKQRRGVGLGFQPAAPKHMHIDKYASKSIKFED